MKYSSNLYNDTSENNYDKVALFYQTLANLGSDGQVRASKISQISEISTNDKVLYVGVGSGEDATLAAQITKNITCIDISEKMLNNTKNSFQKAEVTGEFINKNILEHNLKEHYDIVTVNYFLNLFKEPLMKKVFKHIVSLVKPGGKILIADYAPPQGNSFLKFFHIINFWFAIVFFWLLNLTPLHPIFDYTTYFDELGLELKEVKYFRIFKVGPYSYQSIVAIKKQKI